MALHEFPPDVLRDLLLSTDGEISSASPFRFLVTNASKPDLQAHMEFLESKSLLDSPSEEDGLVVLQPPLRRALDVAASPIRRILVAEAKAGEGKRSVYVTDGSHVVITMFDRETCFLSDPADLESFRDSLVEAIGVPQQKQKRGKTYQLHPTALTFLGAIQGPWNVDNGSGLGKTLKWPVSRKKAEERLTELLEDEDQANALIDALLADSVLGASNGKLEIHPEFEYLHAAMNSADLLEIQRLEIPGGELEKTLAPVQGLFFGTAGQRCLVWPVGDDSDEVLLFQPDGDELKRLTGYLVGWLDSVE